jgi:hypothetical protein
LIVRACDHIAEFLADIYLSPVAYILQPTSRNPEG